MIHSRGQRGPLPRVRRQPITNPILPVTDLAEAIEFYRSLGFGVTVYDEDYAWVNHDGWEWFHLRRVASVANNQTSAYLHVADADAWRAAMLAASDRRVAIDEPQNMSWGKREFAITDPAGNVVRIGSPS